jgi:hypothetical protein
MTYKEQYVVCNEGCDYYKVAKVAGSQISVGG